jgi:hypothetical protein
VFALFDAVREELSDLFLIAAPKQNLPGETVDDRHRQHIADDADDQCGPVVKAHEYRIGNTAPELNHGDHGYEEAQKVFFQHFYLLVENSFYFTTILFCLQ